MCNKMSSTAMLCKKNKKQSKEKIESQDILKSKKKGYRKNQRINVPKRKLSCDIYFEGIEKYLNDIGEDKDENVFEEVFMESYNDEYDVY